MLSYVSFAATDPIKQFELSEIVPLEVGGLNLAFTNSSLFMALGAALVCGFLALASSKSEMVPGRTQSLAEMTYQFIAGMIRDTIGEDGLRFFPLVFSLFAFILMANMLGMFPYFFTTTSHIIVNFALAGLVISIVILYGFWRNGFKFLKIFAPSGVPAALLPLVAVIEVFSFVSRPISLSVRLFANMLAGHIMLKVFAGFIVMLAGAGGALALLSPLPLILTVAVVALEFLVAFLQAYVFAILTCVYLNDALHPGH
ncbi:MAG: F0F1 ATP synthase subunit A [Pseudomonadota bacterium]